MKLAEALIERKAAKLKLAELRDRLKEAALVQEGDQPAEDPGALFTEANEVGARLEQLIVVINRTNTVARLADGRTLTEAIARRDVLNEHRAILEATLRTVSRPDFRLGRSEVKYLRTVDVAELQRRRDQLAKELRELDTAIQTTNFAVDLSEA